MVSSSGRPIYAGGPLIATNERFSKTTRQAAHDLSHGAGVPRRSHIDLVAARYRAYGGFLEFVTDHFRDRSLEHPAVDRIGPTGRLTTRL
jgi:hypothetical protein